MTTRRQSIHGGVLLARAKKSKPALKARSYHLGAKERELGEARDAPEAEACRCCGVVRWRPDGGDICVGCQAFGGAA